MAPRLALRAAVFAALATLAAATDAAGTKYLEENSQREGVITRSSGLQYEVLTKATDPLAVSPGPSDRCVVHYEGKLLDGTVFDSTRGGFGRPATFAPNQVIRGWTEALQLMKEGEKWRLVIPSDLAYGRRGAGGKILPDAALIFEIELVSVSAGGASAVLPDWLAAIADRTVIEPIRVWHMFCFFVVIVVVQLMLPGGPRVSASHILTEGAESEAKTAALGGSPTRPKRRWRRGSRRSRPSTPSALPSQRAARSASLARMAPNSTRVLDRAHRRGAGPGEDGFRSSPDPRHREDDGREAEGRVNTGATR